MDYSGIVSRAVDVVRRHRALWIVGFLWALVGGGGGGGGGGANFYQFDAGDRGPFGRTGSPNIDPSNMPDWVIPAIIGGCLLALVLFVVTTIARYVLMSGVLRTLDRLDQVGGEPTVRGVWDEGWHVRTWRPFVQNLIIDIPFAVLAILFLIPEAMPVIASLVGGDGEPAAAGLLLTGCLFCLWLIALLIIGAAIGVLKQLWWRSALLDDHDFLSAIGIGFRLGLANRWSLFVMWLVMIAANIVWFVVTAIVLVAFGLLTLAVAVGPAYLMYRSTGELLWPIVYGVPVGFLTFVVPMLAAGGLYLVFQASVWNQVFRALPRRVPGAEPIGPEWYGGGYEGGVTPPAVAPYGADDVRDADFEAPVVDAEFEAPVADVDLETPVADVGYDTAPVTGDEEGHVPDPRDQEPHSPQEGPTA